MFLKNAALTATVLFFGLNVFSQVGINTVSPNAQLDINSGNQAAPSNTDGILIPRIDKFPVANPTVSQNGMMVFLTTAVGLKAPGFYYWDNTVSGWIGIGSKSNWGLNGNAGTNPTTNFIGTTDGQPLVLGANSSEKMRIEAGGNTGIGISSPLAKLHVRNNASGMVPNAEAVGVIENNNNTYLNLLSGTESGILFGANGNATNGAIIYNPVGVTDGMVFRTNGNTNQMVLSSAGNLAIGGFIPTYPLQFNSVLGDKISLWGGAGAHYGFGIQGSLLQIHTVNAVSDVAFGYGSSAAFTETMRIRGNGSVGIGIAAPNAKLQVKSSNQSAPANTDGILIPQILAFPLTNPTFSQNGMMVFLATTIGTKTAGFYYWDNSSTSWIGVGSDHNWGLNGNSGTNPAANFIGTSDNNDFSIGAGNAVVMKVTATGNVGVGSGTPLQKLDVNGNMNLRNQSNNFRIGNAPVLSISNSAARNILAGANAGPILGGTDNCFLGESAGFLSNGSYYNCLIGSKAGYNNYQGIDNIFIGMQAGYTAAQSHANLYIGNYAGFSSDNGSSETVLIGHESGKNLAGNTKNTFVGFHTGTLGTGGNSNSFFGAESGYNNTASGNSFFGSLSGSSNTSGASNSFVGSGAGFANTIGSYNCFFGDDAGLQNTTASLNSFFGSLSGFQNTIGTANAFFGSYAGNKNDADNNSFFGASSGSLNVTGTNNTMLGYSAGQNNVSGAENTLVGASSCVFNAGSFNTSLGYKCGFNNYSGSSNTFIGYKADGIAVLNNATAIGANSIVGASNSLVLGGVGANAVKVGIGVSVPTAELEVNGYTKSGSNAPAVKLLKLTGTTGSSQGVTTPVIHGLDSSKILSVSILLDYSVGNSIPPSYHGSVNYEYDYYITGTTIVVWTKSGNSANILSKPFRILITYEQ